MAAQCDICREVSVCLSCKCTNPPVSLCQRCFERHVAESIGEHAQSNQGATEQCTADGYPAYYFCLCCSYVCNDCLPKHPPSDSHHVFPLSLLSIFHQDSTGTLLKQGELIDELCNILHEQTKNLKSKLVKKVANTFDLIEKYVQDAREQALAQVIKYANEFERESSWMSNLLQTHKYTSNWQPSTELEMLLQMEYRKATAELESSAPDWIFELEVFKTDWERYSRCVNWKYLQQPPAKEPSCIAVANGRVQLFSLPDLCPIEIPEPLCSLVGNLLCLPNTDWFLCDPIQCYQLNPDFTSVQEICSLKISRREPCLAAYRNSVYVFGGKCGLGLSCRAECVDLNSRDSRVLACDLPLPYFRSVPCRHGNTLYFGNTFMSTEVVAFDLLIEKFKKLQIDLKKTNFSISLAFPNDEVLVLNRNFMYSFRSDSQEYLSHPTINDIDFMSQTVPVRCQGDWYVLGRSGDIHMIFSINEATKAIAQVGAFQEPPVQCPVS